MMQERIEIREICSDENQVRQGIYSLLAYLLGEAPSEDALQWLLSLEIEETQTKEGMRRAWEALILSASLSNPKDLLQEYQDLFIGIGQGEILPFASWYLSGSLMEQPLVALRQDLRFLGYARQAHTKEPEDHVAALLEIMSMLLIEEKEESQAAFFNRHIAPWFERLSEDIKEAESAHFYRAVATLLKEFLIIEKIRFIPSLRPSV